MVGDDEDRSLGSVVRDDAVIGQLAKSCRPVPGGRTGGSGTWRAGLVVRALLGIAPTEGELVAALDGDRLTGAAVALAAVLARGSHAIEALHVLLSRTTAVASAAATATNRIRSARLTAAVF